MTASTTATSKTFSPGKQPLTANQIGAMLRSADSSSAVEDVWNNSAKENLSLLCASVDTIASVDFWKSKDLASVFASSDSVKLPPLPPLTSSSSARATSTSTSKPSFASIDAAVGLMSSINPASIPQSLVATLMSKDSVFATKDSVFASIDPLPFKSLDSVVSWAGAGNTNNNDTNMSDVPLTIVGSAAPTFYQSSEWTDDYENTHQEIPYGKDMFRTSDSASGLPPLTGVGGGCNFDDVAPPPPEIKRKSSKCWDKYYETMKRNSTVVSPEIKPTEPTTTESVVVESLPSSPSSTPKRTTTKKGSVTTTKKSKRGEPKQKIYVEPAPKDIISGRGGKSNSWPGNERYRAAIEEAKPAYRDGQKYEKTIMSQEIVENMMAEGRRFLKLEDSGPHRGEYYLMTKNQARKKAGQALREENTPESRKAKRDYYAEMHRQKQGEQQS